MCTGEMGLSRADPPDKPSDRVFVFSTRSLYNIYIYIYIYKYISYVADTHTHASALQPSPGPTYANDCRRSSHLRVCTSPARHTDKHQPTIQPHANKLIDHERPRTPSVVDEHVVDDNKKTEQGHGETRALAYGRGPLYIHTHIYRMLLAYGRGPLQQDHRIIGLFRVVCRPLLPTHIRPDLLLVPCFCVSPTRQ